MINGNTEQKIHKRTPSTILALYDDGNEPPRLEWAKR